jgi:hypothetical protein
VDPLIESLQRLIVQSRETLGAEDPSTLMLEQQLAALLASREPSRKVLWLQPQAGGPEPTPPPDPEPARR